MKDGGGNECGNAEQGDQISLHQFEIEDNSSTVLLELEAVQKNPGSAIKLRRFGLSDLVVYPIGCTNCKNYDFLYRVKYNYDETLFAEVAFNLIY